MEEPALEPVREDTTEPAEPSGTEPGTGRRLAPLLVLLTIACILACASILVVQNQNVETPRPTATATSFTAIPATQAAAYTPTSRPTTDTPSPTASPTYTPTVTQSSGVSRDGQPNQPPCTAKVGDGFCCTAGESSANSPADCPGPPPDPCADHSGVQYAGSTCVCPGIVDNVVICADGFKIDSPTTNQCTPAETCNNNPPPGDSGGDQCQNSVCGDGKCDYPACENSVTCPKDCFG